MSDGGKGGRLLPRIRFLLLLSLSLSLSLCLSLSLAHSAGGWWWIGVHRRVRVVDWDGCVGGGTVWVAREAAEAVRAGGRAAGLRAGVRHLINLVPGDGHNLACKARDQCRWQVDGLVAAARCITTNIINNMERRARKSAIGGRALRRRLLAFPPLFSSRRQSWLIN